LTGIKPLTYWISGQWPADRSATPARSIKLRDAAYLKAAVESLLQLLFSDFSTVRVASAATLSRARRKLDVAMMYLRRQTLRDVGIHNLSIQLSYSFCRYCMDFYFPLATSYLRVAAHQPDLAYSAFNILGFDATTLKKEMFIVEEYSCRPGPLAC